MAACELYPTVWLLNQWSHKYTAPNLEKGQNHQIEVGSHMCLPGRIDIGIHSRLAEGGRIAAVEGVIREVVGGNVLETGDDLVYEGVYVGPKPLLVESAVRSLELQIARCVQSVSFCRYTKNIRCLTCSLQSHTPLRKESLCR